MIRRVTALAIGAPLMMASVSGSGAGGEFLVGLELTRSEIAAGEIASSSTFVTWNYESETEQPVAVPKGGVLLPVDEHPPVSRMVSSDVTASVSLSPAAKPFRSSAEMVIGRNAYPFTWLLPGEHENPRVETNMTPDEAVLSFIPGEEIETANVAVDFSILPGGPMDTRTGRLIGESSRPVRMEAGYSSPISTHEATIWTGIGHLSSVGGSLRATPRQTELGRNPKGRAFSVTIPDLSEDAIVVTLAIGGGNYSVAAPPRVVGDRVVFRPELVLGTMPPVKRSEKRSTEYLHGAAGLLYIVVDPKDRDGPPPHVTLSTPVGSLGTLATYQRGATGLSLVSGPDIRADKLIEKRGRPKGSVPPGCDFGFGVPVSEVVDSTFENRFRMGVPGLTHLSVGGRNHRLLNGLAATTATIDGTLRTLDYATSEARRSVPDAPWDRGWQSALDGHSTTLHEGLITECSTLQDLQQSSVRQSSDGRVQGNEYIVVHRFKDVIVETRLFATSSTKKNVVPTPAGGVRIRALPLDGQTHDMGLSGLMALDDASISVSASGADAASVPLGRETALSGESEPHGYTVSRGSDRWQLSSANWSAPSDMFAPGLRSQGPTSSLVLKRRSGGILPGPPDPTINLGHKIDLFFGTHLSNTVTAPSFSSGLFFALVKA